VLALLCGHMYRLLTAVSFVRRISISRRILTIILSITDKICLDAVAVVTLELTWSARAPLPCTPTYDKHASALDRTFVTVIYWDSWNCSIGKCRTGKWREVARVDNDGLENDGRNRRNGHCKTGKWRIKNDGRIMTDMNSADEKWRTGNCRTGQWRTY